MKLKGSVQRDGRGYKCGTNRWVSLNHISAEAFQFCLLTDQRAIYIEDFSVYQTFDSKSFLAIWNWKSPK
jgi:hypothetical protein